MGKKGKGRREGNKKQKGKGKDDKEGKGRDDLTEKIAKLRRKGREK